MPANVEAALLEMFRAEVETHMAALSDGLLALEKQPNQSDRFEGLMRAAHSIKGAAKIIGLPAAVQVAHAIEDCFVAARKGDVQMASALVDVLLEGIDLLARAADIDDAGAVALDTTDPRIANIAARIQCAATDPPAPTPHEGRERNEIAARRNILVAPAHLTGEWIKSHCDRRIDGQIDLSNSTSIDAAALGFLTLAANANQAPLLAGVAPAMEHLLTVVGLGSMIASTVTEAQP